MFVLTLNLINKCLLIIILNIVLLYWQIWTKSHRSPFLSCAAFSTFGFEGKVAVLADVGPSVRVQPYVFAQHAGFLTANSTLFTYISAPPTAPDIHVLLTRPEAGEHNITAERTSPSLTDELLEHKTIDNPEISFFVEQNRNIK